MKTWTDEMVALPGAESDTALDDRWGDRGAQAAFLCH